MGLRILLCINFIAIGVLLASLVSAQTSGATLKPTPATSKKKVSAEKNQRPQKSELKTLPSDSVVEGSTSNAEERTADWTQKLAIATIALVIATILLVVVAVLQHLDMRSHARHLDDLAKQTKQIAESAAASAKASLMSARTGNETLSVMKAAERGSVYIHSIEYVGLDLKKNPNPFELTLVLKNGGRSAISGLKIEVAFRVDTSPVGLTMSLAYDGQIWPNQIVMPQFFDVTDTINERAPFIVASHHSFATHILISYIDSFGDHHEAPMRYGFVPGRPQDGGGGSWAPIPVETGLSM